MTHTINPTVRKLILEIKRRRKGVIALRSVLRELEGLSSTSTALAETLPPELHRDAQFLRDDARLLHLLDNFLRGVPYSRVEHAKEDNSSRNAAFSLLSSISLSKYKIPRSVFPGPLVFRDCVWDWVYNDRSWSPEMTCEPSTFQTIEKKHDKPEHRPAADS